MPTLLAIVAALGVPCGTVPGSQEVEKTEEEKLLEAIGYVDFSDQNPGSSGDGVVFSDPERCAPGFNLCVSIPTRRADLLDNAGRVVHSFEVEGHGLMRCELLENGDALVIANGTDVARLSWDGEVLWWRQYEAHHDIAFTSNGDVLVPAKEYREAPEIRAGCWITDNPILRLNAATGEELDRLSLYDALRKRPDVIDLGPGIADVDRRQARLQKGDGAEKSGGPKHPLDVLHCNSVEWVDRPDLAEKHSLYAGPLILVSLRHQDTVALIHWERAEVVWAWGRGALQRQHEATLLDDGHLLLLDNGTRQRGWSRVLEVNPWTGEVVWQYRADPPEQFFTPARGTAQRLWNGNVLVANSNAGEAFEVTRGGETVWRYLNPHKSEQGRRAVIRIRRYPQAFVERILKAQR